MLQTRNGKRTAQAALKIAVDLVDEGLITEEQAVMKVEPKQLDALLHPTVQSAKRSRLLRPIATGLPASPGAACGAGRTSPLTTAAEGNKTGHKVVLVRQETSPEDIDGMDSLRGHPDRSRRHDLARSRCCTRHGHLLRLPAAVTSTSAKKTRRFTCRTATICQGGRLAFRSTARPATFTSAKIATRGC